MRLLAVRSGIAIAALVVLLALAVYWVLQTVAGREVLLAQVVARLPAGSSLTWEKAEGPLAGPLILHNLDFRYQQLHFSAAQAYLDPDIRPLLGRKLRLDALRVTDAQLELGPAEDTPFELPRWPDVLPAITMPLAIQADTLVVDGLRITRQAEPLIDIGKIRGGIEIANGEFRATQLKINSNLGDFRADGHYLPGSDYDTDLTVRALMPAPRGKVPARLGLVARGNLAHMEVALAGAAPKPLHASLVLDGRSEPQWRFSARSEELDPALLVPATLMPTPVQPVALELGARGRGGKAQLQGRLRQGEQELVLAPSTVSIDNQVLTVAPLVVEAFGGSTRLQGTADFSDAQNPGFRFAVVAHGLTWVPAPDPTLPDATPVPLHLSEARLGVAGTLSNWAAIGSAAVAREDQSAALEFDLRGNDQRASIKRLKATTPGGTLDLSGAAAWAPLPVWDVTATLANFDPGYFLPGWEGRLSGRLSSSGEQLPAEPGATATRYRASLDVPQLKGRLRGRAVDARAQLAVRGSEGEGDVRLVMGNSHLQASGKVGDRLDVEARLEPLQLDDLVPGGSGSLRGTLQMRGPRQQPDISADLHGSGLQWGDWKAAQLSVVGHLPWRGDSGTVKVQGTAIAVGMLLDQLQLDARGSMENLQLEASAGNELGTLALQGGVRHTGQAWRGELASLRVKPAKGDAWTLRQPAALALQGNAFTLADTCLGAATGGALCVAADWPREGVSVRGDALPLALLQPWLPPNAGRRMYLRGELTIDGKLRPRGNAWEGMFKVASLEGGIRLGDNARGELLQYDHFSFNVDMAPQSIKGYLGVGFQGDGFIDAKVQTGWEANAALTGELYMNMSRLYWMELFSPDLVRPQGLVEGHVSLRGTRTQPSLGGEAKLSSFTGELPALGLTLSEGRGEFIAQPDGSARISAAARTGGEGALQVEGGLSWFGDSTPLQLHIFGQNVLLANTSELRAIANPDLQFSLDKGTMRLRGRVHVPEADLDLERLDRGTAVSADVVVLDPVDPEQGPSSPLDMDLVVSLGDKVKMAGFGLKGGLTGKLQVWAKPGREMTANGGLEVSGRYKAYGQDLTITNGQLLWNYGIVSDPRINIRAEREIGAVTAGIEVTGRAQQPRVEVWSEPAMSQSEALAYLVLGRSLAGASDDQAQQVNAASAALSAGTGLLAAQIGAKLGLDDAGVSQSRALGGSVIGVGKYITPKLYIGYGVSLIGNGSVLTLKYLLRRGFDVEFESSTVENRGSVNWRKEK
ncbi:translocation/assembly module TamB domain-containing protein [Stenotrophomonas sp. YIM B06876]|uniref:translocation/assembly module TamB domain-containing protein n=1 Tax=Stenotrophomonas sp. YIM B06876 TaxID=3060211 RepID=UPI00273840F3|nr:translocation/assembly module TamB domain-containing protein [Stenotrophomonas sp. YIM B06876]